MEEFIKTLYNNADYSDITVKCSEGEIKAHRMVLCGQSEYFKKAIGPESRFKESKDGIIEFPDGSEQGMEDLLRFMYDPGSYGEYWDLNYHLDMAILADKYAVPALEEKALSTFIKRLSVPQSGPWNPEIVVDVMEMCRPYPDRSGRLVAYLAGVADEWFPGIYSSMGRVGVWLDEHPREASKLYGKHFNTLLEKEEFVAKLKEDPQMSFNILQQLNGSLGGKKIEFE